MFKLALAESEAVLCADSVQELEAFLGALRGAVEGVSVWRDGDPAPQFGVGQPAPELAGALERLVEVMVSMASMSISGVRVAVGDDGTVTVPDAEDMVVGQIVRDGKKWAAKVAAEDGKIGRAKTEHATRQAAFQALLTARGVVKTS